MVAPFWTLSTVSDFTKIDPLRYAPGVTTTVPPPAPAAASIAAWMALVSSLFPSPFAPKSLTRKSLAWAIEANGIRASARQHRLRALFTGSPLQLWMKQFDIFRQCLQRIQA